MLTLCLDFSSSTAVSGHRSSPLNTSIYFEAYYANGNRVYKIRKSTATRSHKKIQDFFFFCLGFFAEKRFCEELSEPIVASLFERSARHPPAHTMQIFVKTRASIPRLSIENSV